MKLIYHASGSPDCPLLLLTDLRAGEVSRLQRAVGELARGDRSAAPLHEIVEVESDVRLVLTVADRNAGILDRPPVFECRLTATRWHQVEGLLEPFLVEAAHGYQWLEGSGEVNLLISHDGSW